ncbi:acyl carrier protein [Aestuariivirga litoralis]|uniref:acyl carrier protein n=1 Tax=Aestuariivirga litoralis TaxID=2650924 RepID=UPI0018C4E183|nr:phosphopantetheine-binding protein [Aestuariivirga litoralis]MBG1232333.1 acyl carrier protein [Aestuariivirga litoralis]
MESVSDRLMRLVEKQTGRTFTDLKPTTTLEEMGVDSFDFIELVFLIEDEFHIEVQANANELGENLKTIGDVVTYVESLAVQPAAS